MKAIKTKASIIDNDLPTIQALQELRLNLTEQYGSYLAWLYIDYPISLFTIGYAKRQLEDMFKDDNDSS